MLLSAAVAGEKVGVGWGAGGSVNAAGRDGFSEGRGNA